MHRPAIKAYTPNNNSWLINIVSIAMTSYSIPSINREFTRLVISDIYGIS